MSDNLYDQVHKEARHDWLDERSVPEVKHIRASLRLGHTAYVGCSCGWEAEEIQGRSGDETSRLLRAAFAAHLREQP